MTHITFVLSAILGCASLAYEFSQAGMADPARWFVWLGIAWLLSHWRKWNDDLMTQVLAPTAI